MKYLFVLLLIASCTQRKVDDSNQWKNRTVYYSPDGRNAGISVDSFFTDEPTSSGLVFPKSLTKLTEYGHRNFVFNGDTLLFWPDSAYIKDSSIYFVYKKPK